MVIDYQRVKTLVKDFSLKNSFGQIVLFNLFFEKFFLYLSWCFSWGSCISWVISWIFTWIFLISLILFECNFLKIFGIIKIILEAFLLHSLSRETYKYKSGMKGKINGLKRIGQSSKKKFSLYWLLSFSLLFCSASSMVTLCLGNQMFHFFLYASPIDGSIITFLCA